jgi:PAS domain S-box-containing protein
VQRISRYGTPTREKYPATAKATVAVLLPLGAFLICGLLRRWLEPTFEAPFIAAVAITAWICGTQYAIGATALSLLALDLLFVSSSPFNPATTKGAIKVLLFVAANGVVIALIERLFRTRAKLAEAELRHRNLSELIPFGGWIADSYGNMTSVSESFLNTFGTTIHECRGLGWLGLIDESQRDQVRADWLECMQSGYFWDYEYKMRSGDRREYSVLSRGVPVRDAAGKTRSWVGIHLDITALQRSLETRVRQERDIERFNAELRQIAYASAHDLQEPLRMIASYLQLLSRRYKGKLDADADTFIDYAVEGANRLRSLLQDLLLLQQVGKSSRVPATCDLNAVVAKAAERIPSATIQLDRLPIVIGDEIELVQLFENLLDNAIKYRNPDRDPEIRISAERAGTEWILRVRDNGLGIDSEYLSRIFAIFQRLHPRSAYPGTGIGLAMCKKIVEVHGGRIWAESQPGEGSTFCFSLPAG